MLKGNYMRDILGTAVGADDEISLEGFSRKDILGQRRVQGHISEMISTKLPMLKMLPETIC